MRRRPQRKRPNKLTLRHDAVALCLKASANIPVPSLPLSAASHRLSTLSRMCSQPLTANRYHLSRAVAAREEQEVLGAGVEPAHLAAPEPKSGVSAIPPPEQNL